ncbi:MAG TPA: HWE histidine kinase domain-containing protein [Steroidobacteraceae bacterium]|jgi:two-component sensor histidine kinase
MTAASNDATRDPERYLCSILDRLTAATTRDEALRIANAAAAELAGVDGLYLLATGQESSGERPRNGVTVIVSLNETSGHSAVCFSWQPGRAADQQQTRKLELLAKTLGLAARNWRKDEDQALQLRDERHASAELRHRLRNNLALVRSIVRRSCETAESAEHLALHVDARIGAVVRTHGVVAAAGHLGVDLEELIRAELVATVVPDERYRLQGPAVRLHARGAQSLGLAVHELTTNSLKFGALAAESGSLAVTWTVTSGPAAELNLSWMESGVTIASRAPRRRGFGQELIESTLPYELDARTELAFTPGGVHCTIAVPLQACAAGSADSEVPTHPAARVGRAS